MLTTSLRASGLGATARIAPVGVFSSAVVVCATPCAPLNVRLSQTSSDGSVFPLVEKRRHRLSVRSGSLPSPPASSQAKSPGGGRSAMGPAEAEPSEDTVEEPIYLSARGRIQGRDVVDELGMVCASAATTRSIFFDLFVKLKRIFGGEIHGYSSMLNECTAEAMNRLRTTAADMGATSVRKVRIQISATTDTPFGIYIFCQVYGSAVKCVPTGARVPTEYIESSE